MHTPGPWEIAGATLVYAPGERGANICAVSEPRATTLVQYTEPMLGSPDSQETYANANLIAAAPELLAALQQIRGFVAIMDASNWRDMRLHIERQCAVITKAEGT